MNLAQCIHEPIHGVRHAVYLDPMWTLLYLGALEHGLVDPAAVDGMGRHLCGLWSCPAWTSACCLRVGALDRHVLHWLHSESRTGAWPV